MEENINTKLFSDITIKLYESDNDEEEAVASIKSSKFLLSGLPYFKQRFNHEFKSDTTLKTIKLVLNTPVFHISVETIKIFFVLYHKFFCFENLGKQRCAVVSHLFLTFLFYVYVMEWRNFTVM